MQDIRIAVVQMNSRVGDTGGNISTMERFLSAAAAAGVDILCFPELSINGYNAGDTSRPVAESIDGASVQALVELGRRFGLTFMAGLLERDIGGIVYNTQVVFDAKGVVGSYRKNHVPTTENGTWSQGSEMPVFAHEKARYGIEICYDSHFPELSTILAERGAEILFFPHASGMGESAADKKARWLRYMPARAYDNGVYVAVCNPVGDTGAGICFAGVSFICDARGEVVAEAASSTEEEMVVADLKGAELAAARSVPETFFRHFRRPEMYAKWTRGN